MHDAATFPSDEKRRHQFIPVDEAPPTYPEDAPSSSRADASRQSRRQADNSTRQDEEDEEAEAEEIHQRDSHRPASEDSDVAWETIESLEIEEPPVAPSAEPLVVRTYRKFHHGVNQVDQALTKYVNVTVLQYIYGTIIGTIVLALLYFFGSSIPRLKTAKRYEEGSLRAYLQKQVEPNQIMAHAQAMAPLLGPSAFEAEPEALARWIQDTLASYSMGRTALVDHYVLQDSGTQTWTFQNEEHTVPREALIAHSAPGDATGPIVHVHLAEEADLVFLASQNVQLQGSIALIRRDPKVFFQAQLARVAKLGVAGILVYQPVLPGTEGQDGAGAAIGGDAALPWAQPGDPLTPGVAAGKSVKVLARGEAPALLNVPIQSLSVEEAHHILAKLESHGVDVTHDWAMPGFTGSMWTGNASAPHVMLSSHMSENVKTPIYSALSEIDGTESEQTLVVGTSMSLANAAVLLEVARVFANLNSEHSWMPRRNLVFAFWAGSETNFLGSTEWVESQTKSLRYTGIAYLNLDNALSGTGELDIAAHTSLHTGILTAVAHLDNSGTVLTEPRRFSNAIGFSARAGLPSAEIGYADAVTSQACLRQTACIDRVDPGALNQAKLAKLLSLLILEIVDELFLPIDLRATVQSVEQSAQHVAHNSSLAVDQSLAKVFQILEERTHAFELFKADWDLALVESQGIETPGAAVGRSNWNYAVVSFQRALIRNARWTVWFENRLYGPSALLERQDENWALPRVRDALYEGDLQKAQGLLQMVGELLLEATKLLDF